MFPPVINILVADDDQDDCFFFEEAIQELSLKSQITFVNDGVSLLHHLSTVPSLPDIVFLDLNMPLKNGIECLTEIKRNEHFSLLPVIVCSTSLTNDIIRQITTLGATHYYRKPSDFGMIKEAISESLSYAFNK